MTEKPIIGSPHAHSRANKWPLGWAACSLKLSLPAEACMQLHVCVCVCTYESVTQYSAGEEQVCRTGCGPGQSSRSSMWPAPAGRGCGATRRDKQKESQSGPDSASGTKCACGKRRRSNISHTHTQAFRHFPLFHKQKLIEMSQTLMFWLTF